MLDYTQYLHQRVYSTNHKLWVASWFNTYGNRLACLTSSRQVTVPAASVTMYHLTQCWPQQTRQIPVPLAYTHCRTLWSRILNNINVASIHQLAAIVDCSQCTTYHRINHTNSILLLLSWFLVTAASTATHNITLHYITNVTYISIYYKQLR